MNVEHILRLADEYQMKRIIQSCGKFLLTINKTKTNAMPIILLAQDYDLTDVCEACHIPLAQLSVRELKGLKGFELMNGENTRKLLLPLLDKAEQKNNENLQKVNRLQRAVSQVEELKSMIRRVYPQFKGMIECALYFALGGKTPNVVNKCSAHITIPMKTKLLIGDSETVHCSLCAEMTREIGRIAYGTSPSLRWKEDLMKLLQDMSNCLNSKKKKHIY